MIAQFNLSWPFTPSEIKKAVAGLGDDFSYSLMADPNTISKGGSMPVWVSVEKPETIEALKQPIKISVASEFDEKVLVEKTLPITFVKSLEPEKDIEEEPILAKEK